MEVTFLHRRCLVSFVPMNGLQNLLSQKWPPFSVKLGLPRHCCRNFPSECSPLMRQSSALQTFARQAQITAANCVSCLTTSVTVVSLNGTETKCEKERTL